jgi:hypothetical protein
MGTDEMRTTISPVTGMMKHVGEETGKILSAFHKRRRQVLAWTKRNSGTSLDLGPYGACLNDLPG